MSRLDSLPAALQLIDRLLDQRSRPAQFPPPGPLAAASGGPEPGPLAQQAILANIVRELLADEPE
jgi:hypothetical protein